MDCEFYNEIGPGSPAGAVLVPARRAARRLMRPMLYRLRDILRALDGGQDDARRQLDALRARVDALQAEAAALRAEADRSRGLRAEQAELVGRMTTVEDLLLRTLSVRQAA